MTEKPSKNDLSEYLLGINSSDGSSEENSKPNNSDALSSYLLGNAAPVVDSAVSPTDTPEVEPATQPSAAPAVAPNAFGIPDTSTPSTPAANTPPSPAIVPLVEEPEFDPKPGILQSVIEFGKETFTSFQRANASEDALEKLGGLVDYIDAGEAVPELIAAEYADLINTRAELGENAIIQKIAASDDVAEALTAAFQNSDAIFQTIVEQYPDIIEEVGASVAGGLTGGAGGTLVAGPAGTVVGAVGGAASAGAVVAKSNAYRAYLQGKIQGHLQTRGLKATGANVAAFMNSGDGAEAMDKASTYSSVISATSAVAGLVGGGAITSTLGKLAGKLGLEVAEEGGKIVIKGGVRRKAGEFAASTTIELGGKKVIREGIRRKAVEFAASTAIELGGEVAASASVGEDVTYGELVLELGASSIQSGVSGAIGVTARNIAGTAVDGDATTERVAPTLVDPEPELETFTPKKKDSFATKGSANTKRNKLRVERPNSTFETQDSPTGNGFIVVETVRDPSLSPLGSDTSLPDSSPTAGKPADALRVNSIPSDTQESGPLVSFDDFAAISDGQGKKFDSARQINERTGALSDEAIKAEHKKLGKELKKARKVLDDPSKRSDLSNQEQMDLQSTVADLNDRLNALPRNTGKVSQYLKNADKLQGFKRKVRQNLAINAPVNAKNATVSFKSEFASGQNVLDFHRKSFEKIAADVAKDFDNPEAFEQAYEDLYSNIMVDSTKNIKFRLDESILPENFDPATDPITPDMIMYNEDGSIPLTITDTSDPEITSEYAIDKRFASIMEPIIKNKANTFRFIKEKLAVPRSEQLKQLLTVRTADQTDKMAKMIAKIDPSSNIDHAGFSRKAQWLRAFENNEGLDADIQDLVDRGIIVDTSYPQAELLQWVQENSKEDISFDDPSADDPYNRFLEGMAKATSLKKFHDLTNNEFRNEDGSTPIPIHAALGGFQDNTPLSKSYKSLMHVSMEIFNAQRNLDFYNKVTFENSAHISAVYRSQMGGINAKEWYSDVTSPKKGSEAEARMNAYKDVLRLEVVARDKNLKGNDAAINAAVEAQYKRRLMELNPSNNPDGRGNDINIFKFALPSDGQTKSAGGQIFARKSKMSAEESAWLGEVKDVGIAFSHMQKMFTEYASQTKYAKELTKLFMESDNPVMFRSQKEAELSGQFDTVPIDFPDVYNSNSLKKVYVSPDIEDFMIFNSQIPIMQGKIAEAYGTVNQVTKIALTIPNPSLVAANAQSNMTLAMAAMPFLTLDADNKSKFPQFIVESVMDVVRTLGSVPTDLESRAAVVVSGTGALAGDIESQKKLGDFLGAAFDFIDKVDDTVFTKPQQILRSDRKELLSEPSILRKVDGTKFRQRAETAASIQTLSINLHRAPEVAMQSFVFKVFEDYAKQRWGMSDADASKFGSEALRVVGVNILNSPRALQHLQQTPLGTFVGWQTSLSLSAGKMPFFMADMHKVDVLVAGRKRYGKNFNLSSSPADQVATAKQDAFSVGSSASRGVTSSLIALTAPIAVGSALYGFGTSVLDLFDDEEPDKIATSLNMKGFRTLTYPNVQNRDFDIVAHSADGRITKYIDRTRLNSVGSVQETMNAIRRADFENGDTLAEIGNIIEPITGVYTTLNFGAVSISEAISGFDEQGHRVTPLGASGAEQLADRLIHVGKKTFNTSYLRGANENIQQLMNNTTVSEKTGEGIDVREKILGYMGLKITTQDNALRMAQMTAVSLLNINQAKRELGELVLKRNIVPDTDISHNLRSMKDVYEREMRKIISYQNAAQDLGMKAAFVKSFLSEKTQISGDELTSIMKNDVPVFKLEKSFGESRIEKLQTRTPGVTSNVNLNDNAGNVIDLLKNLK